jgi:hypothetical protein
MVTGATDSGAGSPSPTTTTCSIVFISGRLRASSGMSVPSTSTTRSWACEAM